MTSRAIREKEFARWPGYERLYRQAFEVAAQRNTERLGDRKINGQRWHNGTEMFDWWMAERTGYIDVNQCDLFSTD
jgi:hypothetical protein